MADEKTWAIGGPAEWCPCAAGLGDLSFVYYYMADLEYLFPKLFPGVITIVLLPFAVIYSPLIPFVPV